MALTKTPVCDFGKKAEDFKLKSINNELLPFYVNTKDKDAKLIQRTIKTNPTQFLPHNYERSVYVDGNISIDNYDILNNYLKNTESYDIICFDHPNRKSIFDEARVVEQFKLEKNQNIKKIIKEMNENNFKDDIGLCETNVLIRNHKIIKVFNKDWCRCINICKRDQISFDYLLFKHNIKYLKKTYKEKLFFTVKFKHINPKNRYIY